MSMRKTPVVQAATMEHTRTVPCVTEAISRVLSRTASQLSALERQTEHTNIRYT